jgi:DNA-binding response OmpR family regulator
MTDKKEKILIIEGDSGFGEQIVASLKKSGYSNVTLVKNGTEGLKAIYDFLPHLVIVDITLPGTDGYQILSQKQSEPLLAKIPVFLLSTQGVPINMRNVPQGSVNEFIMALHASPDSIAEKVDRQFDHEAVSAASTPAPAGSNGVSKKKLLWVEDDKLIGTILAKKLIASGFDLFHAKNGEEALEALKASIPDAVVVDLLLPGMSGFDILQSIKMDERLKNIPTMVLSNLSKPSDIEKARILGAKKFLVKAAASLDQIVAEIKELCR